jgi:cobalt-zinc-cadmium efflux system outer membrane protein
MSCPHVVPWAFAFAIVLAAPFESSAESTRSLTLTTALQRAVAANPKLAVAARDIGIAAGKRIQAGAIPNPEISFELNDGCFRDR